MGLKQGKIRTSNLQYYLGKKQEVTFRSSWELKAFQILEMYGKIGKIIGWSSEDVIIPYKCDLDEKVHKYYMDLKIETKARTLLVEIKPYKDTHFPNKPKFFKTEKQKINYERQVATVIKNQNKWEQTLKYCAMMSERTGRPWDFQIWTEKRNAKSPPPNKYIREAFTV